MGSLDELSDWPRSTKLGGSVTLNAASGNHVSAPVLHHAEAVGEDRVGRVAVRHVRSLVREFVAELGDDPHHVIQHLVQEEEIVIDRDHPYILACRPHAEPPVALMHSIVTVTTGLRWQSAPDEAQLRATLRRVLPEAADAPMDLHVRPAGAPSRHRHGIAFVGDYVVKFAWSAAASALVLGQARLLTALVDLPTPVPIPMVVSA